MDFMNRESGILVLPDDSARFRRESLPVVYPRREAPAPRTSARPLPATPARSSPTAHATPHHFTRETALVMGLLLVIGLVAAYDVYLSIKYQDTLRFQELNPIGRLLMAFDGGGVAVFMGVKVFGTLIVISTVQMLYLYKRRMGLTVAGALAAIQLMVAAYLVLA
jgi:hypothetical protein